MTQPCTNCSAPVDGRYCASCGQKCFESSDRRFGHLLSEFAHGLTDLDGRVWRSLLALLFRPGLLSLDYNEGRRARWLSPVTLASIETSSRPCCGQTWMTRVPDAH